MRKLSAVLAALLAIAMLCSPALAQAIARTPTGASDTGPAVRTDELLTQLKEIQTRTLAILQKAQFSGDLQTALGAAAEARANAELLAILTGRLTPREATQAEASPTGPLYLLAFKDRRIVAAIAYWVDGDMLHYVARNGTRERASLNTIDRDFTELINRDRHVEVRLPAAK